jgi:hypothetical protein
MLGAGWTLPSRTLRLGAVFPILASTAFAAPSPAAEAPEPEAAPETPGRPERGLTIGLRSGWAFPLGDRLGNEPLSDSYVGLLPFWLDAGYRLSPRVFVGAYFQYGLLFVASSLCEAPLDGCHGYDLRAGVDLHYHLRPDGPVDTWFGAGIGYESSALTIESTEQSASRTDSGLEYLNLQLGADFTLSDRIRAGPFATLTIASYTTESVENPDTPAKKYQIPSQETHNFLFLGLRVKYDL